MSTPPVEFYGTVPLKEGVTLVDVVNLVREHFTAEKQAVLVIPDPTNWTPPDDWELWAGVSLSLEGSDLFYLFDGEWGWDFSDSFDPFIKDLEQLAAEAWESREGDDVDQDDEVFVWRGPSERAIAEAKVIAAHAQVEEAKAAYDRAVENLRKQSP